jgi:uncharacterized BrkB/YihY/UPF0761 family membrane protein
MRVLNRATVGIALGVGVLALSAASASAEIACSGNRCWHVKERYEYPPALLKLASSFIQMIGIGVGMSTTHGANTRGVDIGVVDVGLSDERS